MKPLIADLLQNDPKIALAKKNLLEALNEHRAKITKVLPPDPDKKMAYETLINNFSAYRGIPLFYPYIGSGIGNGALVELRDGSVKYDFISGIGVHFGHSLPLINEVLFEASYQNTVMQGPLQQNIESYELMQTLIEASGLDHCFLTSSGAMACENALKLLLQKKHPKARILAFDRCFMGRTLTLSQITDKPFFRRNLPLNISIDYVPFGAGDDPKPALDALKKHLSRYPNEHACMCFELIQGEAGFFGGSKGFFEPLMHLLKEHDIAVLVDEVQTFGRTDKLFAFQHFELDAYVDVVTVGKLAHTCATLFRSAYKPLRGTIAQTYSASTSMIKASLAIVKTLLNEGFLGPNGKNAQLRERFVKHLKTLAKRHPKAVEGPFGYGAMVAFTPFGGDREKVANFSKLLFENGVIAFMAGSNPTRLRFHPPLGATTLQDIDNVCHLLDETLYQFEKQVVATSS